MWTAPADVEQLLDRCAVFVDIGGHVEGRCDVREDDRDTLWLYVWSRSRISASSFAVGRSPPGPDKLGERQKWDTVAPFA